VVALWALAASPLTAAPSSNRVHRVSDFRPPHYPGYGSRQRGAPSRLLALDDKVLYVAGEYSTGQDLWVSDGSASGTRLLRELCGSSYCSLESWVSTGSFAFLGIRNSDPDGDHVRLWRSDGTAAGTYPLTAPLPTAYMIESTTWDLVLAGPFVYFWSCDDGVCGLWSSDGTIAGTQRLGDRRFVVTGAVVPWGDDVYFLGWRGRDVDSLWHASRRTGQIDQIRALPSRYASPSSLVFAGGRLFFIADDHGRELWTSDGTAAGTVPLTHFRPEDALPECTTLTPLGGRVWLFANDRAHGWQLWSSDGTLAGTRQATDLPQSAWGPIYPGALEPPLPGNQLAWIGGRLVFVAVPKGTKEPQLWTTDGDPRSTTLLSGCPHGCPQLDEEGSFVVIGDRAAFFAWRPNRFNLWVTDGTGGGTIELPFAADESSLYGYQLAAAGGRWFFTDGAALWTSDGTRAGTVRFAGFHGELDLPSALAAVSERVFFAGLDKRKAKGLWQAAGAAASEVLTPPYEPDHYLGPLIGAAGDHVLGSFQGCWSADAEGIVSLPAAATDGRCSSDAIVTSVGPRAFVFESWESLFYNGASFWSTDGTAEGTTPIVLGDAKVWSNVVSWDGGTRALYVSTGGLWTSDGTAAGTALRVPLSGLTSSLRVAGERVYFVLASGGTQAVWSSDGTLAGTQPLSPAWASVVSDPSILGDRVYVLARETADAPLALWSVPVGGGAAETVPLPAIDAGNAEALTTAAGRLWFAAQIAGDRTGGWWLWASDGTAGGTRRLPVDVSATYGRLTVTALGGAVYFPSSDASHGRELWRSNGTVAGTGPVLDLAPGLADGIQTSTVVEWRGRLWFGAEDGVHGMELWSSDGTARGTRLEVDLAPGPAGSRPYHLQVAGDRLFFVADDGTTGRQLWVLDPG